MKDSSMISTFRSLLSMMTVSSTSVIRKPHKSKYAPNNPETTITMRGNNPPFNSAKVRLLIINAENDPTAISNSPTKTRSTVLSTSTIVSSVSFLTIGAIIFHHLTTITCIGFCSMCAIKVSCVKHRDIVLERSTLPVYCSLPPT